jgi:hypothetical protein
MKFYAVLLLPFALSSCVTSSGKSITDYPEAKTHIQCLSTKSREYAQEQGGPLELGIAVSSACNSTRMKLETAFRKDNNARVTAMVFDQMQVNDAKTASSWIVEVRRRN